MNWFVSRRIVESLNIHYQSRQNYKELKAAQHMMGAMSAPQEKLTEKEQVVLRCLSIGMSNKIIANTLHNSEGTIRNHVSQILAKLEVKDRTQAVIKAINQNLI